MLDLLTATVIISALIFSRLDYANSVFYGSPSRHLARLQRAQNAAAAQKPLQLPSVDTLRKLHWLPVQWIIKFKLASLTFKAMHTRTHLTSSSYGISYCPSRVIRSSSSSNLLQFPAITLWLAIFLHSCSNYLELSSQLTPFTVHLIHSTLSVFTSKHIFTYQLLIPFSSILRRLRFNCVVNCALLMDLLT